MYILRTLANELGELLVNERLVNEINSWHFRCSRSQAVTRT